MAEREPGTVIIEGALMGGSLLREAKAARAADRPSTIDMDRMPKGSSDDILTVLVAAPSGIKLWRLRAGLRGDPVRFASFDWKDIESIGLGKTPWAFSDTFALPDAGKDCVVFFCVVKTCAGMTFVVAFTVATDLSAAKAPL